MGRHDVVVLGRDEIGLIRDLASRLARQRHVLPGPGRPPKVGWRALAADLHGTSRVSTSELKHWFTLNDTQRRAIPRTDLAAIAARLMPFAGLAERRSLEPLVAPPCRATARIRAPRRDLLVHTRARDFGLAVALRSAESDAASFHWMSALDRLDAARARASGADVLTLGVARARLAWTAGVLDSGVDVLLSDLASSGKDAADALLAEAYEMLGTLRRTQGFYAQAEDDLSRALRLAQLTGQPRIEAGVLHQQGRVLLERWLNYVRRDRTALRAADRLFLRAFDLDAPLRGHPIDGHHWRYRASIAVWTAPRAADELVGAAARAFGTDPGMGHVELLRATALSLTSPGVAAAGHADRALGHFSEMNYVQGISRALSLRAAMRIPGGETHDYRAALAAMDDHAAAVLAFPYPPLVEMHAQGVHGSALFALRALIIGLHRRRQEKHVARWVTTLDERIASGDGTYAHVKLFPQNLPRARAVLRAALAA